MSIDTLRLERIETASHLIDPIFRDTPQIFDDSFSRLLERETLLKIETLNPIRSFKGRGADFLLRDTGENRAIVCASAGNFGQAMAYAARHRGLPVHVFVPADANPQKIARMRELGARVVVGGADFDAAKDDAVAHAAGRQDCVFVEDGAVPHIAEGAGTIGVELAPLHLDTVVVPVGNGALISGIGRWLKEYSRRTRVIGVCAAGAPAMAHSWRTGRPVSTAEARTAADGLAVRVAVPEAVEWMRGVVDDMVLVDDDEIYAALRLLRDSLGLIVEPSAAVGIAAIANRDIPGTRVGTVLTGSNFAPDLTKSL
ncbi:threonine/serine dehydratase [Streptomonospora nanhaiensis]|uniref:Threonine dehydratase n=2 Tax=Streptomonospora nanhaiensis TaxID=1323731 RepID=A0A853BKI0_9ACTN|nr:pyridoxal-phosphate dependent enzyme [Streptomonospora nanhaiensis]MBV2364769.1 pyridoxal-phosphate dependent enzyme [Streptomonospora nanhaiensis]MBV2366717.1 pyridoxal-phosphate dependent enzyme [Streptomonospora nanhaiensis]MBX9391678.1 pyridoxal-phosphate dependent enzyme [Streptomonospora nanhaiensis]NYI96009.1 threonine dehydratase [Streptomonospora nanhaiensis]